MNGLTTYFFEKSISWYFDLPGHLETSEFDYIHKNSRGNRCFGRKCSIQASRPSCLGTTYLYIYIYIYIKKVRSSGHFLFGADGWMDGRMGGWTDRPSFFQIRLPDVELWPKSVCFWDNYRQVIRAFKGIYQVIYAHIEVLVNFFRFLLKFRF